MLSRPYPKDKQGHAFKVLNNLVTSQQGLWLWSSELSSLLGELFSAEDGQPKVVWIHILELIHVMIDQDMYGEVTRQQVHKSNELIQTLATNAHILVKVAHAHQGRSMSKQVAMVLVSLATCGAVLMETCCDYDAVVSFLGNDCLCSPHLELQSMSLFFVIKSCLDDMSNDTYAMALCRVLGGEQLPLALSALQQPAVAG